MDVYSMIPLRDKLGEMLGNNINIANCCSIYAAAGILHTYILTYILTRTNYLVIYMYVHTSYIDMYNCEALKNMARNLIFSNFAVCSKTPGFNDLSQPLVEYVL